MYLAKAIGSDSSLQFVLQGKDDSFLLGMQKAVSPADLVTCFRERSGNILQPFPEEHRVIILHFHFLRYHVLGYYCLMLFKANCSFWLQLTGYPLSIWLKTESDTSYYLCLFLILNYDSKFSCCLFHVALIF